jgi:hypothetical protein
MRPSEIRATLLNDHQEIRAAMTALRAVAARARDGEDTADELQASVRDLADRVDAHNRREEEQLQDLLGSMDDWGLARGTAMIQEHAKEHARLQTALLGLRTASAENAGVGVIALIALMRAHMDREEAVLLAPEVFRDDVAAPRDV